MKIVMKITESNREPHRKDVCGTDTAQQFSEKHYRGENIKKERQRKI